MLARTYDADSAIAIVLPPPDGAGGLVVEAVDQKRFEADAA